MRANNSINSKLKVVIIITFSLGFCKNLQGQTNIFVSAMARSNHLTDFSGTQPASFQYQTMPISVNYALGIEQALFPTFSMQLGFMRNASKIISESYLGSNFDKGELGYGSSRVRSFPWETFVSLKKVVYRRNGFDLFLCAGASLVLQPPGIGVLSTTWLIDPNGVNGRDTSMIIERGIFKRSDYRPFGVHTQFGISKRFKNNMNVSIAALFYYATPSNNVITKVTWEDKIYQSSAIQQRYFGGLNLSISYTIIKNHTKVFRQ